MEEFRFSQRDLDDLHNTIRIIKSADLTHFGLGIGLGFLKAVDEANLACLLVGAMGTGKTRRLEALKDITRKNWLTADWMTLYSAATPWEESDEGRRDIWSGKRVTWVSRDFSRVTYEVQINTLKLVCALATEHGVHGRTRSYKIDIEDSYVSWFGAIAFHLFNALWYSPHWRDNFQDRLIRYYVLPIGLKRVNPAPISAEWAVPTVQEKEVKSPEGEWYFDEAVKIFRMHFSKQRAYEYALRWLIGNAMVNDRNYTSEADYKFLNLNRINFAIEKLASYRATLSAPLFIDIDSLILFSEALLSNGIEPEQIAAEYSCPLSNWEHLLNGSYLLEVKDGKILPNSEIWEKSIRPQIWFSEGCVTGKWKLMKTIDEYILEPWVKGKQRRRMVY